MTLHIEEELKLCCTLSAWLPISKQTTHHSSKLLLLTRLCLQDCKSICGKVVSSFWINHTVALPNLCCKIKIKWERNVYPIIAFELCNECMSSFESHSWKWLQIIAATQYAHLEKHLAWKSRKAELFISGQVGGLKLNTMAKLVHFKDDLRHKHWQFKAALDIT